MDNDIIMNSGCGRPSLCKLKNNYTKFENVQDIDESFIGKEVIILYKYPQLLFGNYHQDILYYGVFSNGPVHTYETHIWIKDYKVNKIGLISKKDLPVKILT
jgi:hypothetical protein